MIIKEKDSFIKKLFLYRTFLYRFTTFKTNTKDEELETIIEALNIKKRSKRIYYIIDKACAFIDEYYKDKNTCRFENGKCICHRKQKLDYINGCCRKCKYQSNHGCTTKNVTCKLFYCTYALKEEERLQFNQIKILKLLSLKQRFILKNSYFKSIEEVTKGLNYGIIYDMIVNHILFWVKNGKRNRKFA